MARTPFYKTACRLSLTYATWVNIKRLAKIFMFEARCAALLPGYNNIAIEAAEARGIPVCTCPGVNAASVAEGALMMMLMLARRVHEQEV